jgi:hypothetical protein
MTKKLLTAALAIAACAALWGAVCPRNASDGKVPEAEQVPGAAARQPPMPSQKKTGA